jgi:hypothetical protein
VGIRAADASGHGRCRHDGRARQVTLRLARAHASLEIPVRGGDPDLARLEQAHAQADARSAARRQRLRARLDQRLPVTALLGLLLDLLAGRGDVELDSVRHTLAADHSRRRRDVLDARVGARDEVGLVHADLALFQFGERCRDLDAVRSGDVRRDLPQVQPDPRRVDRVGVRGGRVLGPRAQLLFGHPFHAQRGQ